MIYKFITNDPEMAAYAVSCGVNRIFVDMEHLGKEARQGGLDTHMAKHTPEDVARIRERLPDAGIMARINPVHKGTLDEVDAVARAGADTLMLPMFTTAKEVEEIIGAIAGRLRLCLLLETPQALTRLDEILEHASGIDEIHIGLNDLHLGMGLSFMFEILTGGWVDFAAEKIRSKGIRFGFGGIARIGEGDVPADLILGEHIRLGSEMVILSRTFKQNAQNVDQLKKSLNLKEEIQKLDECLEAFRQVEEKALLDNRLMLRDAVRKRVNKLLLAQTSSIYSGLGAIREVEKKSLVKEGEKLPPDRQKPLSFHKALFLQKSEILQWQKPLLISLFNRYLPETDPYFAGSPKEVDPSIPYDLVITPLLDWFPDVLKRISRPKRVHFTSSGVDKLQKMGIDKEMKGVSVTSAAGVNAVAIAEYVMGGILSFAKQFHLFRDRQKEEAWKRPWLHEIRGDCLGIIGLGHVGRSIVPLARGMGLRVRGCDLQTSPMEGVEMIHPVSRRNELAAWADYLVVSVPLTDETRGIADAGMFQKMKPTALFINVSRGETTVTDDLVKALESKEIAGAVLDVFEEEPLPAGHPFWKMEQVIMTPHVAGTTQRYMEHLFSSLREAKPVHF